MIIFHGTVGVSFLLWSCGIGGMLPLPMPALLTQVSAPRGFFILLLATSTKPGSEWVLLEPHGVVDTVGVV